MEDLSNVLIAHQIKERREVDPINHRVDNAFYVFACCLNEAEGRPVGALSVKFCIDKNDIIFRKSVTEGIELFLRLDYSNFGLAHLQLCLSLA